jgi:hypothetical protein
LLLSCEFRECERFALDQRENRVAEQERVVAVVEPERELVKVGRKVLAAELVVAADDTAIKEAPHVLNGVRVNVAAYIVLNKIIRAKDV